MQKIKGSGRRSRRRQVSDSYILPIQALTLKMPHSRDRNSKLPSKKLLTWSDLWFKRKPSNAKHMSFKMHFASPQTKPPPPLEPSTTLYDTPASDLTSLLSDELLLLVFSKLPESQRNPNSLVCKRWLALQGRLVHSLKLLDWVFLESGRVFRRFPNLTDVDVLSACVESRRNSGILLSHRLVSVYLDSDFSVCPFICDDDLLPTVSIDRGLRVLSRGCPNLRKLVVIGATKTGLTKTGLSSVLEECPMLQEMELHRCTNLSLRGISACQNLQILKLVGIVDGFYGSVISDIGLTILAHGCKRLVKLELCGCEGSYDGIRAIGQCCQMLEELTLYDHRMDEGWIASLSFCENLKTLKFQSCKKIDPSPGPVEHLGSCPTLERLYLQRCHLRDRQSVTALFMVCGAVRDIVVQDCWGLDNEIFSIASFCRRVKFLSLEGCLLLTTEGLESVVLSWVELQRLRVVSCNNIRDSNVSPALSMLFSILKEFQWRPDSRSLLSSSLAGTGVGKKGCRFFKRA